MAQSGSKRQSNNAPIWAPALLNKKSSATNRDALYNNSTSNAFVNNITASVYPVSNGDIATDTAYPAHTGWLLKKVGTGGRAGRIQTEVLVAGGIIYPYAITITAQPADKTVVGNTANTLAVVATINPANTISYQWKANPGSGFVVLTNSGVYSNVTTNTLSISNVAGLDSVGYQCVLYTANSALATNVYSATATLHVT